MTDRYEHRTRDNMAERQLERICLAIGFVAGMAFTLGASAALATPWTDETGNCHTKHCQLTGIPDEPVKPHEPTGGSYDPPPKEQHNGFSCYHEGAWVYHAAARFNMAPQHDTAAKNEALDRLERLGDEVAMSKVCRPWQIAAGFKIAEVL